MNGSRCRFYVIQRLRFAGDHPGRGHGELSLGATELRIGDAIDFVGRREARNAGADLLDDTGEVRTEGERRLRANLALALTDDRVPGSDARGHHAHQNFVWARRRHRHILDHYDLGRPEAMNPNCFHGQFLPDFKTLESRLGIPHTRRHLVSTQG
jgi:hypothetical protein